MKRYGIVVFLLLNCFGISRAAFTPTTVIISTTQLQAGTTINVGGIIGTTTTTNAPTGYLGEYVSTVTLTAINFPANGIWGDLVSIGVTGGDWDFNETATAQQAGSTSFSGYRIGVSTFSGNNGSLLTDGNTDVEVSSPTSSFGSGGSLAGVRLSLPTSATVFLKMYALYGSSQPTVMGRLTGRRIR